MTAEVFTVEVQKIRANRIANPSFESGLASGTSFGMTLAALNNAATAYSGSWSLRMTALTSSPDIYYETPRLTSVVYGGYTYRASAYVREFDGTTRNMRVSIVLWTADNVFISESMGANVSAGSTYVRASAAVTLPSTSNARYATLRVYPQVSNASVGQVALADALLLEDSSTLGTYFDGSTSGASWIGTISDSISLLPTSTWEQLSNVQQISGFVGRQQVADTFEPSRMNISARYPNGYYEPNYALRVNTQVRVKRTGSAYTMWTGRIRNVTVEWGQPYNSTTTTGVADFVDIECEGALADWGRLQGNNLSVAASDLLTQLSNVLSGTNLQYGTTYTASTAPLLGSSVVSDSLAAWLNTACATVGATIKDGSDNNIVGVNGRDWNGTLPVAFSDTANNSTNQVYDNIVFDSVSADFFTEIELNTTGYGDIVVNTGVAPYRTLRQTTFNASAAQATDLANYLLGIYGDNGFGISEISCKSEAQNSWALDLGYGWWDIIGYYTTVAFRGNVFRCAVLGSSFTATPSESRFTYYLADIGLTPYLILDDTYAGILDKNKLGW